MCNGALCGSVTLRRELLKLWCPNCEKHRYMICRSYEWYGPASICLRCGDAWNDGEWLERPFMRGWRKHRLDEAKRNWRSGRD